MSCAQVLLTVMCLLWLEGEGALESLLCPVRVSWPRQGPGAAAEMCPLFARCQQCCPHGVSGAPRTAALCPHPCVTSRPQTCGFLSFLCLSTPSDVLRLVCTGADAKSSWPVSAWAAGSRLPGARCSPGGRGTASCCPRSWCSSLPGGSARCRPRCGDTGVSAGLVPRWFPRPLRRYLAAHPSRCPSLLCRDPTALISFSWLENMRFLTAAFAIILPLMLLLFCVTVKPRLIKVLPIPSAADEEREGLRNLPALSGEIAFYY